MSTLALHSALYKERQGTDYLSRTFQSSELHTPKDTNRGTIDEDCYKVVQNKTPRIPKTPWGRSFSYGGLGPLNLPADHRSKWEPQERVEKGHRHFSSGVQPHPRGMTIQQQYTKTPLQRSKVRSNDELVPSPTKQYLGKLQVSQKFPAEHPYASHISKFSLFPSYDPADSKKRSHIPTETHPTLPASAKASAPDPSILGKTKGTPARHEVVKQMSDSEKLPLSWPEGPHYFQLLKGPGRTRQIYYPTPPSTASPNSGSRITDTSLKAASALDSVIKGQWTTSYQAAYSRSAPAGRSYDYMNGRISHSDKMSSCPGTSAAFQDKYGSRLTRSLPDSKEMENQVLGDAKSFNRSHSDVSMDTLRSARSVQFNGSVTFSDGNSVKEIPLQQNDRERMIPPKSSPLASRGGTKTDSQRSSSAYYPSYSIHTMPSQAYNALLTGSTNTDFDQEKINVQEERGAGSERLLEIQRNWSKSAAHKAFNEVYPEKTPDLRRKPDLRITTNERRHIIPEAEAHAYRLH